LDSIDHRMQSFVAWHRQIPQEARRVEEHEAHCHAAAWLRRHIGGRGIVHSHVIGYVVGERWWTFFFQRTVTTAIHGTEQWWIEAYDYTGRNWSSYYYYSSEGQWSRTAYPPRQQELKRAVANNSAGAR
jgi:hypothetical protein